MSDDFVIDDLNSYERSRRPNSGRIGKTGERELAKLLSERFPDHPPFSRTVVSGARWAQVGLSEQTHGIMAGDLVCPEKFKFCIESKFGYDDIDLCQAVANGNSQLDKFLQQAKESADRAKRIPMACWRKKRKPWLAFIPNFAINYLPDQYLVYQNWVGLSMEKLLENPDTFFFS